MSLDHLQCFASKVVVIVSTFLQATLSSRFDQGEMGEDIPLTRESVHAVVKEGKTRKIENSQWGLFRSNCVVASLFLFVVIIAITNVQSSILVFIDKCDALYNLRRLDLIANQNGTQNDYISSTCNL